jgi:hypothetical protein
VDLEKQKCFKVSICIFIECLGKRDVSESFNLLLCY